MDVAAAAASAAFGSGNSHSAEPSTHSRSPAAQHSGFPAEPSGSAATDREQEHSNRNSSGRRDCVSVPPAAAWSPTVLGTPERRPGRFDGDPALVSARKKLEAGSITEDEYRQIASVHTRGHLYESLVRGSSVVPTEGTGGRGGGGSGGDGGGGDGGGRGGGGGDGGGGRRGGRDGGGGGGGGGDRTASTPAVVEIARRKLADGDITQEEFDQVAKMQQHMDALTKDDAYINIQ